jgi:hypothetical protein
MRTVSSEEALAIWTLPSMQTLFTECSCPVSVFKHSPLLTFQMRTVLSSEALAIRPLSGLSEQTLITDSSCPTSVFKHRPLRTSHMRIVLS